MNDYIKKEFTDACLCYAGKSFQENPKPALVPGNSFVEMNKLLDEAEEKGQVSTSGPGNFKIVQINSKCVIDEHSSSRCRSRLSSFILH